MESLLQKRNNTIMPRLPSIPGHSLSSLPITTGSRLKADRLLKGRANQDILCEDMLVVSWNREGLLTRPLSATTASNLARPPAIVKAALRKFAIEACLPASSRKAATKGTSMRAQACPMAKGGGLTLGWPRGPPNNFYP